MVIIHAKTGDTLLDVTGVELADGSQYVGLQDTDVEALRELGLELIFVHNHPNGTEASYDDLKSAFDAGAKLLIVITPSGTRIRLHPWQIRYGGSPRRESQL